MKLDIFGEVIFILALQKLVAKHFTLSYDTRQPGTILTFSLTYLIIFWTVSFYGHKLLSYNQTWLELKNNRAKCFQGENKLAEKFSSSAE